MYSRLLVLARPLKDLCKSVGEDTIEVGEFAVVGVEFWVVILELEVEVMGVKGFTIVKRGFLSTIWSSGRKSVLKEKKITTLVTKRI